MLSQSERQKFFNKSYRGLKAQGFKRAVDDNGCCQYSTKTGLRCAIGQLLPKGLRGIRSWIGDVCSSVKPRLVAAGIPVDADMEFFQELQNAHDDAETTPGGMKSALFNLSKKHNLKIPSR